MSDRDVVIRVENISKLYRLGEVGTGSLAHDVNRWWRKVRGKENPYLKIGEVNDRTKPAARAVASNESRVTGEEGPGAVASYWSRVKTNPPLDPPPATSYPLQRRQAHPPPVTRYSVGDASATRYSADRRFCIRYQLLATRYGIAQRCFVAGGRHGVSSGIDRPRAQRAELTTAAASALDSGRSTQPVDELLAVASSS
jgi:hypothetical protein